MKRLIIVLLLLVPLMLESKTEPTANLVRRYQDSISGEIYYGCAYGLENINDMPDTLLHALMDSLCRIDACNYCTFYTSFYYAKHPHHKEADSYLLGVYRIGNSYVPDGFYPNEDDTLKENLPKIIMFLGAVILVMLFWYNRDKGPESNPAPPVSRKGRQVDVPEEVMDAADAMGHRSYEDFAYAVLWAKKIMQRPTDYLILDTETTGTGKKDVVIEVAITDLQGNPILNTKIKPESLRRIPAAATQIHGITLKDLEEAPSFAEVRDEIAQAVSGKTVLIYNAEFDERLLDQTTYEENTPTISFRNDCVMLKYSQYKGKWNSYYHEYRWQKLPGAGHNALTDCQATAKVIEKMASHWPGQIPEK